MKKMEIKMQEFVELPISGRRSLLYEWINLIDVLDYQLFIDNIRIKDKDDLFDWHITNLDLFR